MHYTVTVVVDGETSAEALGAVEVALDPFNEELAEGRMVTLSATARDDALAEARLEGDPVDPADVAAMSRLLSDWTGYDVAWDAEHHEWRYETYCNDLGRWDWWILGGRWAGAFLLHEGVTDYRTGSSPLFSLDEQSIPSGWADLARVRDIDLEGMRSKARKEAEQLLSEYTLATAGHTPGPCWNDLRIQYGEDLDQARAKYRSDPWVIAARRFCGPLQDPHEFWHVGKPDPAAAFLDACEQGTGASYAWLQDGTWIVPDRQDDTSARWAALGATAWVANIDCHT